MLLDGVRISVSLATAEFEPERDGTRLVFTEQGAFLDGYEMPAPREQGMGSLLDSLGQWLQSSRSEAGERPTGQPRSRTVAKLTVGQTALARPGGHPRGSPVRPRSRGGA